MPNCKMIVNYKKHLFFRGEDYLKGMDRKPIFQFRAGVAVHLYICTGVQNILDIS